MKIAFTSCMNLGSDPDAVQLVWNRIAVEQPDYLFLLGDQIYMDFFPTLGAPAGWDLAKFKAVMTAKYEAQWNRPNFKLLLAALRQRQGNGGGVYGTWDDHDFAWNNACGPEVEPAVKTVSRELFSQFMQIDPPTAGLYYSVPLVHGQQTIGRAIFLDTRWYRDVPGDNHDLLGEDQFRFLTRELDEETGLVVLCAGTPIRATGNGWMRYQRDYKRFLKIIGQRKIIFLSGDIHENAFLPPAGGTNLYEVISSGAFVTKYKYVGKRENFGILEYAPGRIDIKHFDKHGLEMHNTIDNATFVHDELL